MDNKRTFIAISDRATVTAFVNICAYLYTVVSGKSYECPNQSANSCYECLPYGPFARYFSLSRNTARLICLVYLFRARTDCVKLYYNAIFLANYVTLHLGLV